MFAPDPLLDVLLRGVILITVGLLWVILLVRVNGLRSFSKMTNFDFAMTVAVGSLLAASGQATEWTDYLQVLIAMAALFAVQYAIARLRRRSSGFSALVQNTPVLLMQDGRILHRALERTRVSEADLVAKLREANALDLSAVRAVVLETTGDISVLHGEHLDETLLKDVRRDGTPRAAPGGTKPAPTG